jgi:primosomal replication protein N
MGGNVNRLQMSATLIERTNLRYTPAGIPVIEAQLQHRSQAVEAGIDRQLDFPFGAIAIGDTARQLADESLGRHLQLSGFLAPRSRRSPRLLVHVLEFTRCATSDEMSAIGND